MYNRNYGGFDYVRIYSELLKSVLNRKVCVYKPVTDGYTRTLPAILQQMKLTLLISTFLFLSYFSYSQIRKKDLDGEWLSKNDSELYYKTDTIRLHQNINHFYQKEKSCHQIKWTLAKSSFKISEVNNCTEPGRVKEYNAKEKLKLKNTDFGKTLEIFRDKESIDKFRVISYNEERIEKYPYDIKQLDLMRFDELKDEKLYKYVDSLIFKVLNYKPEIDQNGNSGITIADSNPNVKIKVRDFINKNPEPLIVVNGYPIENRDILKKLLLVETSAIKYLTKEQSLSIYGSRAINGVILLITSEKRFKTVRKKYGR